MFVRAHRHPGSHILAFLGKNTQESEGLRAHGLCLCLCVSKSFILQNLLKEEVTFTSFMSLFAIFNWISLWLLPLFLYWNYSMSTISSNFQIKWTFFYWRLTVTGTQCIFNKYQSIECWRNFEYRMKYWPT